MELKDEEILRAMIGKNADHYLEKFIASVHYSL